MKLTVIGCSGSTSGPDSAASSYLVQAPFEGRTFTLVLDLGPGAFGALHRHVRPRDIDAVALSHLHPDHCLDLCALYVAASYSGGDAWPRQTVYGPSGTAARITRAYEVAEPDAVDESAGIATSFAYVDWRADQHIGPFEVRTARMAHPVEAYALRIEERSSGRSLVYSGDTGPTPALVELAVGADLLLVESGFMEAPNNPPGLHLNGRQAAEAASAAGVGAAVLTHIPPWHSPEVVLAEGRPHFAGPLELATCGASWTLE